MHFYYRITNKTNGKVYIGETAEPGERWSKHKTAGRKLPKLTPQPIHIAMNEEGIHNFIFEIISCSKTDEFKKEIEDLIIQQYDAKNPDLGYNRDRNGVAHTKDSKEKMSISHNGTPVSEEAKLKISIARTGSIPWNKGIKWQNGKHSDELKVNVKNDKAAGLTRNQIAAKYNLTINSVKHILRVYKR